MRAFNTRIVVKPIRDNHPSNRVNKRWIMFALAGTNRGLSFGYSQNSSLTCAALAGKYGGQSFRVCWYFEFNNFIIAAAFPGDKRSLLRTNLSLRDNTPEVGTPEFGIPEVGTLEVGTSEVGTLEVGTLEVGTLEVGTLEFGIPEVGTSKVGTSEVGAPSALTT